jgi:hypothetical protein
MRKAWMAGLHNVEHDWLSFFPADAEANLISFPQAKQQRMYA